MTASQLVTGKWGTESPPTRAGPEAMPRGKPNKFQTTSCLVSVNPWYTLTVGRERDLSLFPQSLVDWGNPLAHTSYSHVFWVLFSYEPPYYSAAICTGHYCPEFSEPSRESHFNLLLLLLGKALHSSINSCLQTPADHTAPGRSSSEPLFVQQ